MSVEQPSLFEEKPAELTGEQIIRAIQEGFNPWTGVEDEEMRDGLNDDFYYGWKESSTPIGTFVEIADWNGGDGHAMGRVVLHKESGRYFLATGTYSSWDGSEYDKLVEAEPYEFTETRYREKKR